MRKLIAKIGLEVSQKKLLLRSGTLCEETVVIFDGTVYFEQLAENIFVFVKFFRLKG
jgi:hypothetical protein